MSDRGPYSDDFKAGACALVAAGQPIAQVARDLGVARNTVKAWVQDRADRSSTAAGGIVAAAAAGSRRGVLVAVRDELAAKIAAGVSARDLTLNARLLDETMMKIDSIDAADEAEQEATVVEDGPWDPDTI